MIYENGYKTFDGHSCLMACVKNYLRYHHYNVEESDIAFASGSLDVYYLEDNCQDVLGSNIYYAVTDFLKKYHMSYKYQQCGGASVEEELFQMIYLNKEISLEVFNLGLSYNPIFLRTPMVPHIINAIGIRENEVCVSDSYVPVNPSKSFEGWVGMEQLIKGWLEAGCGYFLWDIRDSNYAINELIRCLPYNLLNFLENYLNGGMDKGYYRGLDAMLQLKNSIALVGKNSNYKQTNLDKLNFMMKTSGFYAIKLLVAEAVGRLVYVKGMMNLSDAYRECIDMINKWGSYSMRMVKVSMRPSMERIQMLVKGLEDILSEENEIYHKLITELKQV